MSGEASEQRVRDVAALLGVADFVYSPSVVSKGNANREVSDGLLICSQGAAVLQVKARDRVAAATDSAAKASGWLRKNFVEAVRQGQGTVREIHSRWATGAPVSAVAVRALDFPPARRDEFAVSLGNPTDWPIIVVLDHPAPRGVQLPATDGVLAVTMHDWQEVNRAIRSVNGLVRYVNRILAAQPSQTLTLGREAGRFRSVADADVQAAMASPTGIPWFTLDGSSEDPGVELYRDLLESVWRGEPRGEPLSAAECRIILNCLDDVPVGLQARLGAKVVAKRDELGRTGRTQSFLAKLEDCLLLCVCTTEANYPDGQRWKSELTTLAPARIALWHEQFGTQTQAVCIGIRTTADGTEYTHVYAAYELSLLLPLALREDVEARFGVPNLKRQPGN